MLVSLVLEVQLNEGDAFVKATCDLEELHVGKITVLAVAAPVTWERVFVGIFFAEVLVV